MMNDPRQCGTVPIACPDCGTEYLTGYHGHCPKCCIVEDHATECVVDKEED